VRFGVVTLVSLVLLGVFSAGSASATGYGGDVDYWGKFTVSIANNRVTALQGTSGGVPCGDGVQIDPVTFTLAAPVPVTNGKFHAAGTTTDDYNDTVQWSLDASVSVTRTISGTVSISGPEPATHATTCSKTFHVAAIIPPRNLAPKLDTNFVDATPPRRNPVAPAVYFDYRHGVITHLSANAGTDCNQSEFPARLYTTAYRLDPVQVNGGRFKVVADVLDDYSVVTHVVVSGRIKGKVARGTIASSRYWDVNGTLEHCTRHLSWVARSSHPVASAGGAFYDVEPYRAQQAGGSWRYYFAARPHNCINHVVAVRFTIVGGPSRTVACNTIRKVGPLKPKRNYLIVVTGIRVRAGKKLSRVRLGTLSAYLPGDDAAWQPGPYIP
jgi:hypothetical protein